MRLAHVIIKLKTRQNLVEFLLANNLRVSFWGLERRRTGDLVFDPALWRLAHRVRSPRFCQTLARARPESLKEALTITVAL
jgi:hypothetical protein